MSADLRQLAANLASLNEIVAEMVTALAERGVSDGGYAAVARSVLRDHSHALGFDFQCEPPASAP